jgi:hypothetical protein
MSTLEKTIAAALEPVVQEIIGTQARVRTLETAPAPEPPRAGERGDKGDKGDPGESIKGDKGDPGDKGDKGDKGDPGESIKGDKGEPGDKGERGEPGLSIAGDKGDKGDLGEKGSPGDRGDKGDKGDRGNDGQSVKGDRGEPGEKGERGAPGVDGVSVKGEPGEKGERGDDGVSIEAVEIGEGEFDLIFTNKDRVTLKLPLGIKGDKGDKGEDGLTLKGDDGERGEKGEPGVPGVGIDAKLWMPGVYREGSIVQYEFGRFYVATRDTASTPGEDVDWLRMGRSGFRWRGLKKDGAHYDHGDFFIDNGSTFLVVEDKPRMFAQRGKDGANGTNGMNGKDGASVTEMVITSNGELLLTRSDGEVFAADIRPMLVPIIERMVQAHLRSLNVITH